MVATQLPDPLDDGHRVIKFSPRAKTASAPAKPNVSSANKNPEPAQRPASVDYRQRMMANLAAAAFAVVLAGFGVWLVTTLNHMRQTQDCIMMGIRNCGDSDTPHS
jgi:hypothetical protein